MFRAKVVWSPVELEYLKANLDKEPRDQLCIALAKTRSALDKQIKVVQGKAVASTKGPAYQSRIGKRDDLGIFVRSGWEANVMRWFKSGNSTYTDPEYEPQTFSFTDHVPPKGSALSYTPDFRVTKGKKKYWVEVKGGFLRGADKTKLRRFKKYYPSDFKDFVAIIPSKTSKTGKFFIETLGVPEANIVEYTKLNREMKTKVANWE